MATETNNSGNEQEVKKVTFDEAQQAKVEELIKEAMGRAASQLRAEVASTKSTLETTIQELETAKAALSSARTPSEKKEAKGDIEALQNQINEMKNASQSTLQQLDQLKQANQAKELELREAKTRDREYRKSVILKEAAGKITPINTDQVVTLTSNCVVWDDQRGSFSVVDPITGSPRMNAAFEPMSLDEFYVEFASRNNHLVKSNNKTGSGSGESRRFDISGDGRYTVEQIFGPKSDARLAQSLATKDIAEYRRLKQIAVDNGVLYGKRST